MKIENKLLIVAVTVLIIVFVALQFLRAYGEDMSGRDSHLNCIAGCKEGCHFYMGDNIKGKTKEESEEYLKNQMRLYQIAEDEILQRVDLCENRRRKSNSNNDRPFYPYTELLEKE